MSTFNQSFFEAGNDIVALFLNTDANSDISSDWVKLTHYDRCYVLVAKPSGSAGDDLSIKLQQATDSSGTGAKALNFSKLWHKVGTQTGVTQWTAVELTTATDDLDLVSVNSTDLATDTSAALILVEVLAESLDANGGFDWINLEIEGDDIGNALVISAFAIFTGGKYPQAVPLSAIA